jgi:uncharacterized membrane protein YjjB (DUF3815 family)
MKSRNIRKLSPIIAIVLFIAFSATWTLVDKFSLAGVIVSALASLIVTNIVIYIAKKMSRRNTGNAR